MHLSANSELAKTSINHVIYSIIIVMSTQKNRLKRDQALNDATSGQMGEEPGPEPLPDPLPDSDQSIEESRRKAARRHSKHV